MISKLGAITKRAELLFVANSPAIMTGIGVSGVLVTAYLVAKASFKVAADVIIDDVDRMAKDEPSLGWGEFVKTYWKAYIPAVTAGAVTVAAIVTANRIGTRRTAAVAAAYSILDKAYEEYKTRVVDKIGERKERDIRDDIAKSKVAKDPLGDREVVFTDLGKVLCYDTLSGRYFFSDVEIIRKAQNDLNTILHHDYFASLSDFYDMIGLSHTSMSDDMGWNVNKPLRLEFTGALSDKNDPCIAITYGVAPVHNYQRYN